MVAFHRLQPFRALVLGDFLLDSYTTGKVRRISPEAPVPVMEVRGYEERPGGAGNVVLNLQSLGAEVKALGRVGDDVEGMRLQTLLACSLFVEKGYRTPVKNRLIADGQQLIRVDFESIEDTSLEDLAIQELKKMIPEVQVIAISDYGKGFLTRNILSTAIALGKHYGVPVIVDPKGLDFSKYQGASVLKPNLSEALAAAKCSDLDGAARELYAYADTLLVTRSEEGIAVFTKGQREDFPVRFKEVKDVTGAGDTVLSTLCLGLANGLSIGESAQLANLAAGIAIERIGCAQITLSDLAGRLLEYTGKVFHDTVALGQALKEKAYSLLILDKEQAISSHLFSVLRKLAVDDLVLFIEAKEEDDLVHLLATLPEVRAILLRQKSLDSLLQKVPPSRTYQLKKEKLLLKELCDRASAKTEISKIEDH